MLITSLLLLMVLAILGGQVFGYFGRKYPALDNAMFLCWGLSAVCGFIVLYLNFQTTSLMQAVAAAVIFLVDNW